MAVYSLFGILKGISLLFCDNGFVKMQYFVKL